MGRPPEPEGWEKVPRVKHFIPVCDRWEHVPVDVKAVHACGRTVEGLQPPISVTEVRELESNYGTVVKDPEGCSLAQRLDFVATRILALDRLTESPVPFHDARTLRSLGYSRRSQKATSGILSMWQFYSRTSREIPFDPSGLQNIVSIRTSTKRRAKRDSFRVVAKPHNKTGDHLRLVSPIYGVEIRGGDLGG